MVKKPQYTSAAVRSVFCLDGVENYDFRGRLYIGMEKQGYAVSGMADFVKILENVFDYCNFPQASHEIRSFFSVKRNNDEKRMAFMEEKKIVSQPEPKGIRPHLSYRCSSGRMPHGRAVCSGSKRVSPSVSEASLSL